MNLHLDPGTEKIYLGFRGRWGGGLTYVATLSLRGSDNKSIYLLLLSKF